MSDAENEPDVGDEFTEEEIAAIFLDWVTPFLGRIETGSTKNETPWCPEWWEHPEVVDRLAALWRAYVDAAASEDGRAVSSWWVDHWDRHRASILNPERGPFRFCSAEKHNKNRIDETALIVAAAPPDGWTLDG